MTKKEIKQLQKVAEYAGWDVNIQLDTVTFTTLSPLGREICYKYEEIETIEDVEETVYADYSKFDCSKETYKLLDPLGHGNFGTHDATLLEVYKDVKECQKKLGKLDSTLNGPRFRTLQVDVTCVAYYKSEIEVPAELDLEEAAKYAREHMDDIETGELNWLADTDVEESNCKFID